jgi:hypothetical protein
MSDHASMIVESGAGGQTKRISAEGTADLKNDIMHYAFIEPASHEVAAAAFEKHPHLQVPQATIELMAVRSMGPM